MIKRLDLLDDATPHGLSSLEIIENKINEIINEVNIQEIVIKKQANMYQYGLGLELFKQAEQEIKERGR